MGAGNSRLNSSEGEPVPIKTRSTLIGKFEEFKKRRNAESTLSKKQLLKDADEEEGSNISQSSSRETNETEYHKDLVSTKEEKMVPIATTEKISRVVPMENSECATLEELVNINKDIDLREDKVIHENEKVEEEIKTEEGNVVGLVQEVKEENEQEVISEKSCENDDNDSEDEENEELGRFLCPGSPSFRIYCIEADQRKAEEEEEEEECKSPTIVMHQKSRSADSVDSRASRNTRISKEVRQVVETESITKRKGNKMRKFGAVRTLLKVKSCYHPMCTCTGDDRNRLIAAKAAH